MGIPNPVLVGVKIVGAPDETSVRLPGSYAVENVPQRAYDIYSVPIGTATPEQFGAVGDGVANDLAAIQAAFASLPAAGGTVVLSGKTYLIAGTITIPANCSLVGVGDASTIKTNTNATLIQVNGDAVVIQNLRLLGNSVAASQNGIDTNGFSFVRIHNITIGTFMGNDGIRLTLNSAANIGPVVSNCRVQNCNGAAFNINGAQYSQITNCQSYGCTTGIRIAAGNALVTNCNFSLDTVGCLLTTGDGNDAHCVFAGCYFNHSTSHAIQSGAIVNGAFFVGCNIYYADILLTTSTGVVFKDCTIDVTDLYFDGSIGTRFVGCTWPMANANTVHQSFNSHASTESWSENRKLDGTPYLGGYVSMTPANGANALTYAQSFADELDLLAGASAGVTITSAAPPNALMKQWVRNNTTQTVTFGWSSGTTVSLAAGTSALIGASGTNAVKLMAGT